MMIIQPVTLSGKHITLEPLALNHLNLLSEVGLDQELWRITMTLIRSRDEMQQYIETAMQEAKEGRSLPFAIYHKASGKYVGCTRYGNIDRSNRRVEIGWTWIAKPWQRTVVNTEAKYLLLTHAFETLRCIRVEFKTDAINEQSRNALLCIGAKEEGIFRKHMIAPAGRFRDSVYFSIIDDDWPTVKQRLEAKLARSE